MIYITVLLPSFLILRSFKDSSTISHSLLIGEFHDLYFKENNPRTKEVLVSRYQDFYITPHYWTFLHLVAILQPTDIPLVAVFSQFKMPFLIDRYGKTPLHYLLAHDNLDYSTANTLITYILDYLDDCDKRNMYEYQSIIRSLSDLFPFITTKATPRLSHRFLKLSYKKTPPRFNEALPSFGQDVKKHTFSSQPILQPEVEGKIYQPGQDLVNFKTNMLQLDYDATSSDMINTAKILADSDDEDLFKTPLIKNLLDHLWDETKPTMIAISLLFSALILLISVYIGLGERNLGLEITILVLAVVFIMLELIQVRFLGTRYIQSVWNGFDLLFYLLLFAFIITRFVDNENILALEWMSSVIIIVGYVRWVSYLRLFASTSNLFLSTYY